MPTSGGMSAGGDRQAPTKSLYILYLEVKAVVNNRRVDSLLQSGVAAQGEDDFSPLQLSFIREIYKEKEPLPGLSFCILCCRDCLANIFVCFTMEVENIFD